MTTNAKYVKLVVPNSFSNRGWEDYLAGRPFPREYDEWDQVTQRHYERGRLRAAGARRYPRRILGCRTIPPHEPQDIVRRTNGLRLVPRRAHA